jgi:hypothetical protein
MAFCTVRTLIDYRTSKAALYVDCLVLEATGAGGIQIDWGKTMLECYDIHKGMKFGSEPKVGGERIAAVVKGYSNADVGKFCTTNSVLPWLEASTSHQTPERYDEASLCLSSTAITSKPLFLKDPPYLDVFSARCSIARSRIGQCRSIPFRA